MIMNKKYNMYSSEMLIKTTTSLFSNKAEENNMK